MQLKSFSGAHLTYCTNVHPGVEWQEHFAELKAAIPRLKRRISPDKPFGIGLRLSAAAASRLAVPGSVEDFRQWLAKEDLYLFTINGFPYGSFHHDAVKEQVYAPDWQTSERLGYTLNLVQILADLLPDNIEGGISTSPLSYKPWLKNRDAREVVFRKSAEHLAQIAFEMNQIEKTRGRVLHLDIEPEPDCLLENSRETVDFFTDWLIPLGSDYLSENQNVKKEDAKKLILHHIRICYDTCHFAVEFEKATEALERFRKAGIQIGRVHISSALKIELEDDSLKKRQAEERLREFDEAVYLHQVIERRTDGSFRQYRDLSEAFSGLYDPDAVEWRVHFHVPVFLNRFEKMSSTQDHISETVIPLLKQGLCSHFEIETYTWDVLPAPLKSGLIDSVEREFLWTLNLIDSIKKYA